MLNKSLWDFISRAVNFYLTVIDVQNTRNVFFDWTRERTGEQLIQRQDGTLTPQGKRLRALMQKFRVNKSNFWDTWVDRDFVAGDAIINDNPWQ